MEECMQEDRYLFVLLSFDTLYSINLKDLKNCKLQTVFSHLTPHKQPDGSSYPLGMGLFVTHDRHGGSKLHFFGGENLEDRSVYAEDRSIDLDLAYIGEYLNKRPKRPKSLLSIYQNKKTIQELAAKVWLNKKVFSFTPFLTSIINRRLLNDKKRLIIAPDHVQYESDKTTRRIPDHYGYKVRPIVVNMLEKVYVLTTRPFSTSFPRNYGIFGKQVLFEVYDPKKGEWRKLPNPPPRLYREIVGFGVICDLSISHCVFKNKLLLETEFGQFLFDAISEKWKTIESRLYPPILACLEYENFLLAFMRVGLYHDVVAFDLESFGEEDCTTSRDYIPILSIQKNKETKTRYNVYKASLSIVDNNRFCLVFTAVLSKLHVYLFDVITEEPYIVKAERTVHREFDLPQVLFADGDILSTFVVCLEEENVVGQSNESCNGVSNYVVAKDFRSQIATYDIRQRISVCRILQYYDDFRSHFRSRGSLLGFF